MALPDIEMGITPASTPDPAVKVPAAAEMEVVQPTEKIHSTRELLERAREVTAGGKFIFSGFSELTVFLLLESQDKILSLQRKLHEATEDWTDTDSKKLQSHLKEYCTSQFYLIK